MNKQEKAVISVLGIDKKGIISQFSTMLADNNINILDISQTIVDEYFSMIMIVDIAQAKCSIKQLSERSRALGEELGLKVTCQHEDIFKFMHRI